ncbi:MAG: hypothetical protein U0X40_01600 [Ferruginibacter sp.]
MKTILLLIAGCWSLPVFAQKPVSAATKDKPEKEKFVTIRLAKFPVADFPDKNELRVAGISIVQQVTDSFRLGFALKGMDNNKLATLVPAGDLTAFLQELVTRMYKHDYKKDGVQLLWMIKELRMAEKADPGDIGFLRMAADVYVAKEADQYYPVYSIDSVFVREAGGDVTVWHEEDIEIAFKTILRKSLPLAEKALTNTGAALTREAIAGKRQHARSWPILSDTAYQEGAYASFGEFLQNRPSISHFDAVMVDKKSQRIKIISKSTPADTLTIWGLCRNGEIYKYSDESLIPLERQGNGFIVSNFIESAIRHNQLSYLSVITVVVGGLAGAPAAPVFYRVPNKNQLLVKNIPSLTDPAMQPVAARIDMDTGELGF